MATGIKETLELMDAIAVLLGDLKAVLADGKINFGDVGLLFSLFGQFSTLNAGIAGADQIPLELKDLTAEETQQLLAKALELVAIFKPVPAA